MRLTHSVVLVMNHRSTLHLAGKVHIQFSIELWQLNRVANVYHDTYQMLVEPLIRILMIHVNDIIKLPLPRRAVIVQDLNNLGVSQKWGKDEVLDCSHILIEENVTTDQTIAGIHVSIGKVSSIHTFQINIRLVVQLHNRAFQHVGVFCLIERQQLVPNHIMCDRVNVILYKMYLKCISNRGTSCPLRTSPKNGLNGHLEFFRLFWSKTFINEIKVRVQCVTLARIDVRNNVHIEVQTLLKEHIAEVDTQHIIRALYCLLIQVHMLVPIVTIRNGMELFHKAVLLPLWHNWCKVESDNDIIIIDHLVQSGYINIHSILFHKELSPFVEKTISYTLQIYHISISYI